MYETCPLSSTNFHLFSPKSKTSVFVCTRASWVLSQMVLMMCASAVAAPSFALEWWHMLSRRAISGARQPPVSKRQPCNPSAAATQWQIKTKQRAPLCLFSLFIVFQSVSFSVTPLLLSLPVTSPAPYAVHHSSAFSSNVPTEPALMDDPLL